MSKEKYTKFVVALAVLVAFVGVSYLVNQYVQRIFYPRHYSEYVEAYCGELGVPEHVAYAVIKIESGFDEGATSEKGACGLMQLMPGTYSWLKEVRGEAEGDIYDPQENIKCGIFYLGMLYDRYKDWKIALCAYNAGMGNVDKWLEEEPFEIRFIETQYYVNKLEVAMDKYKSLYYR